MLERVWRNREKSYERVFPQQIGVGSHGKSLKLKRAMSDFGSDDSFGAAVAKIKEHYGFEIPVSAVREATLEAAEKAQIILTQKYSQPFRLLPKEGKDWVIGEADGSLICTIPSGKRHQKRPRSWKEIRLVAGQGKEETQTTYGATFGGVEEVGNIWGHCARDAGWGLGSQIHMVADGAEWIQIQAEDIFGDQLRPLCDFFHVSQYLAKAGESINPEDPGTWRKLQQKRLKKGKVTEIIKVLEAHREPPGTPSEEAPVNNAHRYLSNRLDQLDYKAALENKLPIGSGLIESGNRHVLQARLKKAGTAWVEDNAELMAQLRVLRANKNWDILWN